MTNNKELTSFEEATIRIKKEQKIEKFLLWFIIIPSIVFFGFFYARKHVDLKDLQTFYTQKIESLKKISSLK